MTRRCTPVRRRLIATVPSELHGQRRLRFRKDKPIIFINRVRGLWSIDVAENDPVLEQRVEALEQFSQARVVEQVGDLTKRVTSLESARETESPFLATKEDIARLEGLHAATQKQIAAQSELFNTRLAAQSAQFNTRLDTQSELFNKNLQAQSEQFNARLDTQSEQFNKDLQAQSEQLNARLDTQSEQFNKDLQAQSEQLNARLDAQSEQFNKDLQALSDRFDSKQEAQTQQLRKELEQRVNRQTAFIITTIVACTGVLIYIFQNLPS